MLIKTKDAHKMLLANGWELVKGGKGSHRKYKKNGKMFPLPWHGGNKDISKEVEKTLRNVLEK